LTFGGAQTWSRRLAHFGLLTMSLTPCAAGAAARQPSLASASVFVKETVAVPGPSADARRMLRWIVDSGDNLELPFIIVDKVAARVLVFDRQGMPRGSSPVLLGRGRGDTTPPGIGQRKLKEIAQAERITPAGRFVASFGNDLGEADILWVDYDSALSLHRVITGNPSDRRLERLATASIEDNRISYGCINIPVVFFDAVIVPAFNKSNSVVYILPEVKPLTEVFALARTSQVARLGL
jgi:hypothetical protein